MKTNHTLSLTLKTNKVGCHICSSWTPLNGCNHYGPQDYDLNKPVIDAIAKAVHGGNGEIVENSDFYAGINAAIICLRQNNMLLSIPRTLKATGEKEVQS